MSLTTTAPIGASSDARDSIDKDKLVLSGISYESVITEEVIRDVLASLSTHLGEAIDSINNDRFIFFQQYDELRDAGGRIGRKVESLEKMQLYFQGEHVANAQSELSRLSQTVKQKDLILHRMEEEMDRLRTSVEESDALHRICSDLRMQINIHTENLTAAEAAAETAKKKAEKSKARLKDAKAVILQQSEQISSESARHEDDKKKIVALEWQLRTCQTDRTKAKAALSKRITDLESEVENLSNSKNSLQEENRRLLSRIIGHSNAEKAAKEALRDVKKESEEKEKELQNNLARALADLNVASKRESSKENGVAASVSSPEASSPNNEQRSHDHDPNNIEPRGGSPPNLVESSSAVAIERQRVRLLQRKVRQLEHDLDVRERQWEEEKRELLCRAELAENSRYDMEKAIRCAALATEQAAASSPISYDGSNPTSLAVSSAGLDIILEEERKLENEVARLNLSRSDLSRQVAFLTGELVRIDVGHNDAQVAVEQKKRELMQLTGEIDLLNTQIEDERRQKSSKIQTLESTLAGVRCDLIKKEQDLVIKAEVIAGMERAIEEMEARMLEVDDDNRLLRMDLSVLEKDVGRHMQTIVTLTAKCNAVEAERDCLVEDTMAKLKVTDDDAVAAGEASARQLVEEFVRLSIEWKVMRDQRDQLAKILKELQKSNPLLMSSSPSHAEESEDNLDVRLRSERDKLLRNPTPSRRSPLSLPSHLQHCNRSSHTRVPNKRRSITPGRGGNPTRSAVSPFRDADREGDSSDRSVPVRPTIESRHDTKRLNPMRLSKVPAPFAEFTVTPRANRLLPTPPEKVPDGVARSAMSRAMAERPF